jgi:aryl-alcohol dehydrogenase-like predicted oxidoreductase
LNIDQLVLPENSILRQVPPYIYGTTGLGNDQVAFEKRVEMARYAMDRCSWFHTSHKYGSAINVLQEAFRQHPAQVPPCTFKLSGDSLDEVRRQIDFQLKAVGVSKMGLGQLHLDGDLATDFIAGGSSLDGLRAIKAEGLVDGWILEVHPWSSWIAFDHLNEGHGFDVIDGYTFYYNPLQRYALNELFALITEKHRPILALRTVAGGSIAHLATRPADPEDFIGQRAREVLPLYEGSGFANWVDFSMCYVYSQSNVLTTIGSCSSPSHLDALINGITQKDKSFDPALSAKIATFQTRWSDEKDRHAPDWSM